MVNWMRKLLEGAMVDFREVVKKNPDARRYLEKKKRSIQIFLDKGTFHESSFHFSVQGPELSQLWDGQCEESPDIVLKTTSEVLKGILEKRISPMKAFVQRELSIKAPLTDMLLMRKFLS